MKSPLHCQLLLSEHSLQGEALSALLHLLRFAQRAESQGYDADTWLCRQFELAPQQDIPVAPYAAKGDGLATEDGYWLCADPVSLVLQRDSFALAEAPGNLLMAQSQRLSDALNTHFEADGMRFFAVSPHRWYLRLAQKPDLRTHSFAAALHRDIQSFLPQGKDAMHWHRQLNEVQMLLHAHPVNIELEEQGMPPVNSVWLWGGGELQRGAPPAFRLWADDALPRGLAIAHGLMCSPVPASANDWLTQAEAGHAHLIVLPESNTGQSWLQPLADAVRQGRIALTLHLATSRVTSYSLTRRDFLKFWRRPRALEHYLG